MASRFRDLSKFGVRLRLPAFPRPARSSSDSRSASPPPDILDEVIGRRRYKELADRGMGWGDLDTSLGALKKSADEFPSLKSAFGEFHTALGIIVEAVPDTEEYYELASQLTIVAYTLSQCLSDLRSICSISSAGRIALAIQDEATYINGKRGRSEVGRLMEGARDAEDVLGAFSRVRRLFQELQTDISLRIWTKQHAGTLLRLSSVDDALYNSSYSMAIKRHGCMAETREKVQADLQEWVEDPNAAKVYWMNGTAGTGKTTIAYSLCKWLEENQRLGASFFCSRISSSCRNVNSIVPAIAYQLAQYSPTFQSALCKVLESDPDASKLDVVQQLVKLMREPMLADKGVVLEGVVVVIDALDECEDDYGVRLLLGKLLKLGANLPIKFFVTSRPEPAILDGMLSSDRYPPAVLHLHDIEQSVVEEDIKRYLHEALGSKAPSNEIGQLAKRAGGLFIYATTAVQYFLPVLPGEWSADPASRLDAILAVVSQPDKWLARFYTCASILSAAFKCEGETGPMPLVLWTTLCVKEPMTIWDMASFLGLTEKQALSALQSMRPVFHVSRTSGLISILGPSTSDYTLDRLRSEHFYCNKTEHSGYLAHRCFDIMKDQLRFNICGLESSFVFDEDLPGLAQRIKTHISPTLFYACRYWGEHLQLAGASDVLRDKLIDFLSYRLLFWMEVLNLRQCVVKGIPLLVHAEKWLLNAETPAEIQKQAADARDFVTRFAGGTCGRSTPHIYFSALPLCASSSSVYTNYWARTRGLMSIKGTAMSRWDKTAQATWKTGSRVLSVAFSPDGTRIVSSSYAGAIEVRDACTGDVVAGSYEEHTGSVNSVAFSPDGTRVVSGSSDKSIRVWDPCTCNIIAGPFKGHTKPVKSVAFSPDGSRIVSGSEDKTIRMWDAHTGVAPVEPFKGHTSTVNSVVFSPNGARIASGSNDKTIQVWDAYTGNTIAAPFYGHKSWVSSVAFSPDGARIVSGSDDKSIYVWDTQTGNVAAGPFRGHKDSIYSVSFSAEGTRILSSSHDWSIRVWDSCTGSTIAGPFEGHTGVANSAAFSPDGTRIVSGSHDGTIRVWVCDTRASNGIARPSEGHMGLVNSVGFSPDGTRIVSGSHDQTIRLWDTRTGALVSKPLEGHTDWVYSVAFSPDGTSIVSGSNDKTVRVWNSCTGLALAIPFKGHTGSVNSVMFSPDGTRIVSGSNDMTIRMWDARTGDILARPFEGHTKAVNSVAFSPDGRCIASGSDDETIQVWDSSTGDLITEPFRGHTGSVMSIVFSPNGTHIASGSDDMTIRVWDKHTGDIISGPFKGHTGPINSVAFSPEGTHIISGSSDKTTRMWDARTGLAFATPFKGHTDSVHSVVFSPDGTRIVSGSDDGTIRVHDLDMVDVIARKLTGHAPSVNSVGRPPRRTYVASFIRNHKSFIHPSLLMNSVLNTPQQNHAYSELIGIGKRFYRKLWHFPRAFNSNIGQLRLEGGAEPSTEAAHVVDFQLEQDGWITADGAPLFWVFPNLRAHVPFPHSTLVIGPQGSIYVDDQDLSPGKRWRECYIS